MRRIEFVQTNIDGGFPVPSQQGVFEHGEPLWVVSKRELISLLYELRDCCSRNHPRLPEIDQLLAEDDFVIRGTDLPPRIPIKSGGD